MTRQIAVDYIKKTRILGFSDSALRHELEKSGWPAHEIDLAFIESRAVDQKPALESPPAQFVPRTKPQWEEKDKEIFNTEPKPVDLTKSSLAKPQEIFQQSKPSVPLGAPTGTIDGLQFNPPPKSVSSEKPIEPPKEPTVEVPRITQIQKPIITPANELIEPAHPKELPRVGTPDSAARPSLDTKISEVKLATPEPMVMGVPASQLIKPAAPSVELPKKQPEPVELKTFASPVEIKIERVVAPQKQPEYMPKEQMNATQPPRFNPAQEAFVSELMGDKIASANTSSSPTRSAVLESIGVPPRTRNNRTLAAVAISAFFLIASGASAGFWYYQTTLKPQSIVKGALVSAQNMKSYSYDAELQMKIRESKTTLGKAMRPFVPPLAGFALGAMTVGDTASDIDTNYSFTLRAKGAVDAHDPAKPKSEMTLTLGTKDFITPGFPNSNTEFESRLVDDTYYFQVAKLPYFDSATVDPTMPKFTSADITGRWVSINFETFEDDFNNYVKELSLLEPSFVGYHLDLDEQEDLITKKQTQDIEKMWDETRLVVWDDQIVREQENGTDRYRVKGTLDKDSFKRFIVQSASMTGGVVDEEGKKSIEDIFAHIGDIEINAWVDKNSGTLVRFAISGASTLPLNTEVAEGVAEFHLTADLSDIDKPITIAPPADHYDVRNLLEKLFAYAREGFASDNADARDARRLSDLSRIRTALELYKKREGMYPAKLSDLVSEYLATLPTDPFTKKQYRYTRTAKGYTLSAQLEDIKHPILKQDISPGNTLYDIGPAL
ncbi:MAG: hypothetical protein AAB367_03370 [Patescibacteria group bacterium]